MLRWSPSKRRKAEAVRDKIFRGIGTDEPLFEEDMTQIVGPYAVTVNWRKPLRIEEIAQMAPTPEVRERRGRA